MRTLLIGSLVLFFASLGLAQDATCKKGEYETSVTIGAGNTFKYKTSAKGKYGDNVDCTVHYVLDDSCDEMTFSCKKINIKNKKDCSNGDTLVLSSETDEKVVCGKKKKFVFKSSSDLVVHFTSDSKKRAAGAKGCKVTCSRAATSSPSTPAPTTGAPTTTTTTTGAPTTTAEPTPAPTTVPCVDCMTENAQPCQFPFIWQNITFTSCTMFNDDKPWCATQVDSLKNLILGPNDYGWGYCTASCPSDEGYPATGDGPACEVQTTGLPFPPECADRLERDHKNILFLGNSYTYGNDLPGMVKNLASAAGKSATTTMVAPGGQTLSGHVSGGSLNTIRNGDWDVVVIQDQSQRPSFGPGYVFYNILPDVIAIEDAIRSTNPCTVPLYFMTWGKRDGDTGNCNNGATALCTFEGVQEQLTNAYSTFAYVSQPAKVAPAGEAWAAYTDRNSLFAGDGSHASAKGTYLTACTMLESIWPDVSCVGNSYTPVSDAAGLQSVAHQTIMREGWAWPEAGERPCQYCLP